MVNFEKFSGISKPLMRRRQIKCIFNETSELGCLHMRNWLQVTSCMPSLSNLNLTDFSSLSTQKLDKHIGKKKLSSKSIFISTVWCIYIVLFIYFTLIVPVCNWFRVSITFCVWVPRRLTQFLVWKKNSSSTNRFGHRLRMTLAHSVHEELSYLQPLIDPH